MNNFDNNENVDNIIDQIINSAYTEKENIVDDEFINDFISETKEHLEDIDAQVIALEKNPDDEEKIHSMFRAFHTIKGLAGFVDQAVIENIAHKTETLMDLCRKDRVSVNKEIADLILKSSDFIKDICENMNLAQNQEFVSMVDKHLDHVELYEQTLSEGSNIKKIGEILVDQKIITQEDVQEVLQKQSKEYPDLRFGELAIKEEKIKSMDLINALKIQSSSPSNSEKYMRLPTSKIDTLVDMVSEMVIAQSLIEQYANTNYNTDNFFIANIGRIARIVRDLQNLSLFLRLVSLKSTFQKISRIARDTINELGKNIDFSIYGEETEIDRVITEKLLDPLTHLVKNAISHGIEPEEERIKLGKPAEGVVKVSAYSKRGYIFIKIVDDGKGIDTESVYKKALEKGLIDPAKNYSEKEIQEFIMLPGISTIEIANNISGRGVGMDVVKTDILKAGGKIEINSVKDQGTIFTLKIPVNHAVMNGLIVDIEGFKYILQAVHVKYILRPENEQWISVQGVKSMIKVRDDIIPVISISKLFKKNTQDQEPNLVVILEMNNKYRALPVTNVIARREIVVKPTLDEFSKLKYVSGLSILGDGKVSLILDIENLFNIEGAI